MSASRQSPVAGRISDHCEKRPAERGIDGGAVLQLRCDLAVLQQRAEEISGLCEFVPTDRRYAAERRPDQRPGRCLGGEFLRRRDDETVTQT